MRERDIDADHHDDDFDPMMMINIIRSRGDEDDHVMIMTIT
jgi:hypothetical protein